MGIQKVGYFGSVEERYLGSSATGDVAPGAVSPEGHNFRSLGIPDVPILNATGAALHGSRRTG